MNPQTVKASSNMKIVLTSDNKSLDEVIVTGYGNFKKSSFTGAAACCCGSKGTGSGESGRQILGNSSYRCISG